MSRKARVSRWALASLAVVVVVVVAACSSSGYKSVSSPTTAAAAGPTTTAAAALVRVATVPGVGSVLVDASGLTLYHNTKESGTTIVCTGGCTTAWPPLLVTGNEPTPGPGVTGTLDTVTRPDGGTQARYNGMPLYRFAADTKAGDAKGQGLGGVWFAVPATGSAASPATVPTTMPAAGAAAGTTARPAATAAPTTRPPATSPPATAAPATTAPRPTTPPTTSAPPPTTTPPTMPCAYPPCY